MMKESEGIIVDIKKLTADEIENYLLLNDNNLFETLSSRLNIHEYSQKLFENALHFTVYDDDNLVGFSPCYFNNLNDGKAYISALIVLESHKQIGLEVKLLNSIKEYAKQNVFNELLVSFHCENSASTDFYENNLFIKHTQNQHLCVYKFHHNN